jgi:hypothetical protein
MFRDIITRVAAIFAAAPNGWAIHFTTLAEAYCLDCPGQEEEEDHESRYSRPLVDRM